MKILTLDDGAYIYSEDSARDYLHSIGLDYESFETLFYYLNPHYHDILKNLNDYVRRDEIDDWECISDGYLQSYNNLREEIDEECNKFLSGRKITKQKFVEWLKAKLENGLDNY